MSNFYSSLRRSRLYPVVRLESLISRRSRRALMTFSVLCVVVLLVWSHRPLGLLFILLALGAATYVTELYFRSYYFGSILSNVYHPSDLFTFTVLRILVSGQGDDLVRDFLQSATGRMIMRRLGIERSAISAFLAARQTVLAVLPPPPAGGVVTMRVLATWLGANDQSLADWLFQHEIGQNEWLAATDWVVGEIELSAATERWWSRDNLERVEALATDWSYGGTYILEKYARDLSRSPEAGARGQGAASSAASAAQTILTREAEPNALLVGEAGGSAMAVVWQLVRLIKNGDAPGPLNGRRPLLFAAARFLAGFKERTDFEQELLRVFNQAAAAGNVLLIIDNLPALVLGGEALQSGVPVLLDPLWSGGALPLVALADTAAFHQVLEPSGSIMNRFEVVQVPAGGPEEINRNLEAVIHRLEAEHKLFFTYPALVALSESAEHYFSGETVFDQATDLAIEIVPWALLHGLRTIGRAEVLQFVGGKTNIPLGEIGEAEKEKLLHLEERLGERVVGQTKALVAVAGALRRSRAGVRNPKRPVGSFLFLGPTGVGKTETAKALAAVFFGREDLLLRLDMSEYQSGEALNRLIGSFTTGQAGILSSLIRQNPYGVLLLDEFEKTSPAVLNLFLQILDEGFFSDMMGQRVNARNLIFIATSNAGAEVIWKMVEAGRDPADARTELIDTLVASGAFRPELLNRFDEVVIFHPLQNRELTQVAGLLLERLNGRLRERGVTLTITPALVNRVVAEGSNRVFGARPMMRYIQDEVEGAIAKQIISGEVKPGATVTL